MEDWQDLLQPKLEGRVAWTDSPREFVGAALQTLGMHFNSTAADLKAAGISEADLAAAVARLRKHVGPFGTPFLMREISFHSCLHVCCEDRLECMGVPRAALVLPSEGLP